MSARVETSPMRAHISGTIAIAIFAALGIGVLTGSLATRAFTTDAASAPVSAPLWDAQKLEAMEGRVLAESFGPTLAWDQAKLDAMEGRALAERFRDGVVLWDAGKLDAMAGRVLAESFGPRVRS